MQLTVKKSAIESAAKNLSKVIVPNNSLPILSCILCEVSDTRITMTASDAETDIITNVDLETMEGEGRFCVDAKKLIDALAQLPEQTITILATTESDNRFIIRHQNGETFFALQSADDYPTTAIDKYKSMTILKGSMLKKALKNSIWATGQDDLRPVINGVYICATDVDDIDIVASDGHVLVRNTLEYQADGAEIDAIIPKKAAKIIADLLQDDCSAKLLFCENRGSVETDGYDINFRLIEGKYPKYQSVIPQDGNKHATVDRRNLINCMKSVLPFTSDSSKQVRMTFREDTLTIQGEDFDFAEGANNSMACEYKDEMFAIGVKGTSVLQILKLMPDTVDVTMKNPDTAIVFEPNEQDENIDLLMMAMPMIISD